MFYNYKKSKKEQKCNTNFENNRIASKGYAMLSKDAKFYTLEFSRHAIGDNDILIKILYAGICHSDIHTARSEWEKLLILACLGMR